MGNIEEQPCQPKEKLVLPDYLDQIHILFKMFFIVTSTPGKARCFFNNTIAGCMPPKNINTRKLPKKN